MPATAPSAPPRYRSQIRQSLHYFARPHDSIRRTPLTTPAAWRGQDLSASTWLEVLDAAAIAELDAALDHVETLGRPTAALVRDDFPLPTLVRRFDDWRRTIEHGRGFVVLRGIPVQRWSQARCERFFWCFGLHLGIPGAQNPQGDLLGHVQDTGAAMDGSVRQYRTREAIRFHCDLADVVGLLCLQAAERGGRSCIASSVHAYNEVLARRPDLVDRMYEPFRMDTKGEGGVPYISLEPCRHTEGVLRTFWHSEYFRSVERYPWARRLDATEHALLDLYDEILDEPGCMLEMDLQPGDIQLLSNHVIVHGRSAFEDGGRPRHLLRLWLSLPHPPALRERLRRDHARLRLVGRLVAARVERLASRARARLGREHGSKRA